MTYRELVERQLAVRHADLELGLSRAREQEPFVIHVSNLLDKAGFEYTVRMNKDFQTTFNLEYPIQTTTPLSVQFGRRFRRITAFVTMGMNSKFPAIALTATPSVSYSATCRFKGVLNGL
ncbi:phage protein [Neisseria mucosa]|nr:phage protein [Neisseria mucosa]